MVRLIPIIDRGPIARRIIVMIGFFLIFLFILVSAVLNAYSLYVREGRRGAHNMIAFNNASNVQDNVTFSKADFSSKDFVVDVEFLDMKPEKSELSLNANVTRLRYTKERGTLLLGSYKTVPLNRSMYFMDRRITLELTNGDINKYPFDEYVTEVPFAGYVGASKDFVKYITHNTTAPPKEFRYSIIARGNLHNWKFYLKWEKHDRLQGINILKIRIKRSRTVRFFFNVYCRFNVVYYNGYRFYCLSNHFTRSQTDSLESYYHVSFAFRYAEIPSCSAKRSSNRNTYGYDRIVFQHGINCH